jgi:hypothetical protein
MDRNVRSTQESRDKGLADGLADVPSVTAGLNEVDGDVGGGGVCGDVQPTRPMVARRAAAPRQTVRIGPG